MSAPGWTPPPGVLAALDEQEIRMADQPALYARPGTELLHLEHPLTDAVNRAVAEARTADLGWRDALLGLCPWAGLGHTPAHTGQHHGEPCPYWVAMAHLADEPDPRERIAEWRVEVPFKDGKPPLSLNDRHSPMAHARIVDRIKSLTRRALTDAAVPPLAHAHVELHYRPKDRRKRDADNLIATQKCMVDALVQSDARSRWIGLLPDDDARYVSWDRPTIHDPDKERGPATWLVIRTSLETR
jgi:crossover junction endodeoxyribonuclease RusA